MNFADAEITHLNIIMGVNQEYTVTADGYETEEGELDITTDVTVTVTMEV